MQRYKRDEGTQNKKREDGKKKIRLKKEKQAV